MKAFRSYSKSKRWGLLSLLVFALTLGISLPYFQSVRAADVTDGLDVEIIAAYNLIVDSNVMSPSTQQPIVATVIGKFCNTSNNTMTNVLGYIGDYGGDGPGDYPDHTPGTISGGGVSTTYDGTYQFEHLGSTADATRYMGTLLPGQCKYQYWSFTYPKYANWNGGTHNIPSWGTSVKPGDDLWLEFDIWGTGSGATTNADNETWRMTMRNEISAMANKIEPNGNPGGQWFNTDTSVINPGETITTNGILYRLGNINQGFDNDGDGVPDYNAWLQPFGDASYDPSCFRLIETTGVLTVTTTKGDVIIPFKDNLYFTNLPQNNTNAVGLVYYKFMALGGACTIPITPYQEAASGSDNEKFNGDYGSGPAPIKTFEPSVTIDKAGSPAAGVTGALVTYTIGFENTSTTADAGLVLSSGVGGTYGLVIRDTVPAGMTYLGGSAAANNSVPVGYSIRYSTDSGASWSSTDPGNRASTAPNSLVMLQWWLDEPLPKDTGGSNNSGSVTFQANLPGTAPTPPFIENCAEASFADGAPFGESCIVTMIQGTNLIGDRVWWDANADGAQDAGESGIDGVTVWLYYDKNGDGLLDDGDTLITTQTTAGGGAYSFTNLPNGNFLVVVDDQDTDITNNRLVPTTRTVYAVTGLGTTITSPYLYADFGFGPVLAMSKSLTSSNPAYEGETVTWTIDLVNTRPGDGSGQATTCSTTNVYWANAGSLVRGTWVNPGNAYTIYEIDNLYATSAFSGNDDDLRAHPILTGQQAGSIQTVEALYLVKTTGTLLTSGQADQVESNIHVNLTGNATPVLLQYFSNVALNAAATDTLFAFDVTSLETADGWQWSDFSKYYVSINAHKNANADGATVYLNSLGWRVTYDEPCGGSSDTVVTVPLTDEFDASLFEFVSADPAPSSITTGVGGTYNPAGLVTWNNLGPLYAGQTKTVTVVLKALEPPDTDGDGESDPATTTNYARVRDAQFANGSPVNDGNANDDVTIQPTGSIGDTIWNDNGGTTGTADNGVQDGDETGIPGVTVYLDRWNGAAWELIATETTNQNGEYLFEGLRDATYRVRVDTTSLPGTTYTQTGDPDVAPPCSGAGCDNQTNNIVLNNNDGNSLNDNYLAADFGYRVPNTIYGNVWEDNDGDTIQDVGENGILGVPVYLCTSTPCNASTPGAVSILTDIDGNYTFSDLDGGIYYVGVETGSGPVASSAGWNNTVDPESAPGNSQTDPITVSGGNIYGSYDFGYTQTGSSSIGDTLFTDWNGNAQQDGGENGIPGVTVWLYEDSNGDGVIDPITDALIATDTTDANGQYLFENLPAGDYIVLVSEADLPWDYRQTYDPDNGSQGTPCGTCDGQSTVTADGTSAYRNEDFGYQPVGYGSIGDFVWADTDGDGLQDAGEAGLPGVRVYLYVWEDDADGLLGTGERGALVATAVTDANGSYLFSNLPAGNYIVDVDETDAPTGMVVSSTYDHDSNLITPNVSNDPMGVVLASGEDFLDADFGFVTGGSIGDFVWQDNDGDGLWDTYEPGIGSVEVNLYNDVNGNGVYDPSTDTWVDTQFTDGTGYYAFENLPAGNYLVVVTPPSGYTLTGDPDAYSGAGCATPYPPFDPTCTYESFDHQYATTLRGGQSDLSADFGYQPQGVIGDTVWIDSNNNGLRDPDEQGIPNITVWLCATSPCNASTSGVVSTTTDENGEYSFGGLTHGQPYHVRVNVADPDFPAGLTQTYGTAEQSHTIDTSVNNGVYLGLDFGYRFAGSNAIRGTIWYDADSGGQSAGIGDIDAGETTRYADVPVYLWHCGAGTCSDGDETLVGNTLSDSDGAYNFPDLADGTYRVVLSTGSALSGLTPTTPTSYTGIVLDSTTPNAIRDFGVVSTIDFGDLPEAYYNTLLGSNGARHLITSQLYLGAGTPDPDADGQLSTDASGDDNDGNADEDGVTRAVGVANPAHGGWTNGTVASGNGGALTIVIGGTWFGVPQVFIDFDGADSSYNLAEVTLRDVSGNPLVMPLAPGTYTVYFDVPAGTFDGATTRTPMYVRTRLSTTGGLGATGPADTGEVEDHRWDFGPNAVSLADFSAQSADLRWAGWFAGLLVVVAGSFLWWMRRQKVAIR